MSRGNPTSAGQSVADRLGQLGLAGDLRQLRLQPALQLIDDRLGVRLPEPWLTDVPERMVSGQTKANELERLLPWNWQAERLTAAIRA
jgi:hypothetical protein